MAGSKNKILGNIPTGSGNDFERTLNQYDDGIYDFDFGIINGRHFINVACVGLDADVANNISWIRKNEIGISQVKPALQMPHFCILLLNINLKK